MSIKTKTISVFLSIATTLWLSGAVMPMMASAAALTQAQITAIVSLLQSFGADSATVSNVQAALTGGAVSGTTGGTYTFATDLKLGSTGADVKNLQIVLNKDAATQVAVSGAGSPGNETTSFGSLTKAAVIKFQNKYASEVLTPVGLTAGTGYVGSMSRAKLNTLSGGTTGTTGTPVTPGAVVVTPQGKGLTVTAGTQPTSSLDPLNSSRVPYTVVNFTASSDGDVVVNSLVVERTGLANDAAISGVVLLDENNLQVGLEKTLNSVHQVTLTEPFTVKAGQTRTMTIAANRGAVSATSYAGQVAYFALVSVNTSATVNGALPITGSGQTINESLTIGSVTMARGPLDPNASSTSKEIGTTGFTFSSVKVTAGSAEKVSLRSIRWYQSGSAATGDLANIKTYVEGVAYDTTVSSDGKYYTASFGNNGISIDKGFSKEIYVKGDIAGGSARTIQFDIYKTTDLYLVGETYAYGITPPTSTTVSGFHAANPWYYAFSVTISSGTMNVSKATSIEAQNIAINLASQPLGGFIVDVKGEPISVAAMTFRAAIWKGTGTGVAYTSDLTNISMYDENGAVVSGPVDITASSPNIAFSDTVTFPIGIHTYTLKGKVTTDYANNDTISASTTPASDWTTVKGSVTGNTITPSGGTITGSTMTVKSGALAVSVSSVPLAQTVIAGASQFTFANYVLDAGNSGEDVSLNAIITAYDLVPTTNPTTLTSCRLYDGAAVLNSGSNIKNPTAAASTTSFTFDSPLTIPKGTSKTLALKCDIAGNATAGEKFAWGYDDGQNLSPVGKTSGQDIAETETDSVGQYMTIAAAGTYTVVDDSTPGYTVVSAGTTGATLLKLRFAATTEDIDVYRVNFILGGLAASSSALDLANRTVSLYDAANPTVSIATAQFSTSVYATSTLIASGAFRIPSGSYKTLLVKGDIAGISSTIGPLIASGDLLRVAYDGGSNGSANGNYGKGVSSGSTVDGPTQTNITPTGVRIMKAYPSFAKIDLTTSEKILQIGTLKPVYKFSITANAGDVYIYKLTFGVSSSTQTATSTKFGLYAYTDSTFSLADTAFSTDGLVNAGSCYNGFNTGKSAQAISTGADGLYNGIVGGVVEIFPDQGLTTIACNDATTTYKIPSGLTRWFALKASIYQVVAKTTATEYINVNLQGDAAFPVAMATLMGKAGLTGTPAGVNGDTNNDFIWSPNSTTSSISINNLDWTNGYGLVGLPTVSTADEILTNQ